MNRLKLYFGLILLIILKTILCFSMIIILILFSAVFLFINKKSFHYCIDELYNTLN